ncbi:uncharacterized protein LOC122672230 [Telopea speciosissima]|uniref:uncharacterized protein LOC122672230 n=1 Tax=Telopea speciosissima TaxID=54955 RepID=UPI001CC37A92|nr:uncharacterized protein LOC122672230 [Telopea speciosissima]
MTNVLGYLRHCDGGSVPYRSSCRGTEIAVHQERVISYWPRDMVIDYKVVANILQRYIVAGMEQRMLKEGSLVAKAMVERRMELKPEVRMEDLRPAAPKMEETLVKILNLLREYKEYFAWDYSEMPGLDQKLVQHRFPIKDNFRPVKQLPKCMVPDVVLKVKDEIERLLKVGFIRIARYVEWLSNIVPVVKKNGKLRVCIDFRDLNKATPMDEYPMPVTDMLVYSASKN